LITQVCYGAVYLAYVRCKKSANRLEWLRSNGFDDDTVSVYFNFLHGVGTVYERASRSV